MNKYFLYSLFHRMILDDDTRIKYIKGDIAGYIFNKISLIPMDNNKG